MPVRSILSVAGGDEAAIEAGYDSEADAVVLDLEAGVPAESKESARDRVVSSLTQFDSDNVCGVRVNGLDTTWGVDDVKAFLDAPEPPDYLELPDIRGPDTVEVVDELLDEAQSEIEIMVLVEHPSALFRIGEIAVASSRIFAITFGAGDYSAAMGTSPHDTQEMLVARSLVAMAGKANDLLTIDMPSFELSDEDNVSEETRQGRKLGYDGKIAINQMHVDVINSVYS